MVILGKGGGHTWHLLLYRRHSLVGLSSFPLAEGEIDHAEPKKEDWYHKQLRYNNAAIKTRSINKI